MGNQTLVPSQIQSVETYLLELKNYIQFKQSLGSTTFMKTAKVILAAESPTSDDFFIDGRYLSIMEAGGGGSGGGGGSNPGGDPIIVSNDLSTASSAAVANQQQQKLNQYQMLKQKLQRLREEQQQVVVKVFPRYDLSIRLDLYSKRVREIKNTIYSRYGPSTNCLPFYELIITDKAAFLIRQFVKYSLYDRLSTRPFLTAIEKRWIAFQLLCAVNEIHSLQIVHGDMKTENVLVNSFLWVSLADLASYKPVYLSKNHPSADFNYYFDISRRRTCCLAPERLEPMSSTNRPSSSSSSSPPQSASDNLVVEELMPPDPNDFTPAMDIFSLGCVIAELFMERPLFDFAQLLAYRDRKYDPSLELRQEIGDSNVLEMIFSMLSLDPNERKSANEYLQEQSERAFPSYFVYLKNYISRFISARLSADECVVRLKNDLPILLKNFKLDDDNNQVSGGGGGGVDRKKSNDAFLILLSLLLSCVRKVKFAENKFIAIDLMQSFSKFLDDSIILDRVLPYYLCLLDDGSLPRDCLKSPMVKSHVIYALNDCLSNVYNIDVRNMNIFPELIFDCLERASKDESYLVRSAVAKTISSFAITSLRYLEATHSVRSSYFMVNFGGSGGGGGRKSAATSATTATSNPTSTTSAAAGGATDAVVPSDVDSQTTTTTTTTGSSKQAQPQTPQQQQQPIVAANIKKSYIDHYSYEREYEHYQMRVTEIVMHLITEISQTTSNASNAVKEALIRSDIAKLCTFFSRQKTSEFLLPHMITMLNEKTDWSVRAAFFDALCPVLSCIGWESIEIVKPLLEQGLRDSEEFVIYRTLLSLAKMVGIGLLDKQQIFYFLNTHIAPLLCHPSLWIRHGAVNFVCTLCKQQQQQSSSHDQSDNDDDDDDGLDRPSLNGLNTADVLCSVAPTLAKFLSRSDLITYDRAELLFQCLKTPIKRAVYDCIKQDFRADQLFVYLAQRSEIRCLNIFNNQNYLPGYIDCADPSVQEFFDKLCKLGFVEEDEDKLLHMKEFMDKTRMSLLNAGSQTNANNTSSDLLTSSLLNRPGVAADITSLRDGFITIMRDKFQRCNVELLNTKISQFGQDQLRVDLSSFEQQQLQQPSTKKINNVEEKPTSNLNTEWSLMFGGGGGGGQNSNRPESNEEKLKASSSGSQTPIVSVPLQKSVPPRFLVTNYFNNTNQTSSSSSSSARKLNNTDCVIEVEKYLDRCKFIYEDHRLKHSRVARARDTINTSLSSNQVCLSNAMSKWKPRGYLVFNSNEHTRAIDRLSRNADATYFSTCSSADGCVKIWSTESLLTAKSGFYKSVFTYDRQSHESSVSSSSQSSSTFRPMCTSFYNKNSLAILCEDYKFYVIDFNSDRTQYRLYANERLFRSNSCKSFVNSTPQSPSTFNKTSFFYLNRLRTSVTGQQTSKCSHRLCYCSNNYPVEMIRIDDTSPSWSMAATSYYDYFLGNKSSAVKGLFCYSTSTGDVSCIDMRCRSRAFELRRDLRRGYVTSMITDPWYTWLALGTSNGSIEIYDFRFMVPVQTFEHRLRTSVARMCAHPSSPDRIVAAYQGNNEMCVWNMNGGGESKEPELVFWGVQSVPPLCQNKMSNAYISGLVAVSNGGDDTSGTNGLICASSDMKMRYIDLNEPTRDSYIVSSAFNFQHSSKSATDLSSQTVGQFRQSGGGGSSSTNTTEFASSVLSNSVVYEMKRIEGTKVLLEVDTQQQQASTGGSATVTAASSASHSMMPSNLPALIHQSYFTHHQDAISDLVVCYSPTSNRNQPLIVTAARDGTLKIWR